MWTVRLFFLWVFSLAVIYCDFRHRRVPNRLTLGAAAAGLALSAAGGWSAFRTSLCGMVLGFVLLYPAFLLGLVGGGDVKTLAVIGIGTGPDLLWVSFLCGVAASGAMGAVALLAGRLRRAAGKARPPHPGSRARTLPYAAILSLCAAVSALFL
ncbi:MAG: prepilin peptidase [Actinomycetota bacterium]